MLDGRGDRDERTVAGGSDVPVDEPDGAAGELGAPAERGATCARLLGAHYARARRPVQPERPVDAHAAAGRVAVQRLELDEARLEPPVVAQVGEECEDAIR